MMYLYVGCRTTLERNARGNGINVYSVDELTGKLIHHQLLTGLVNPSYLALSQDQQFLYCVHGDGDQASAFLISENDGKLSYLNTQSTGGLNPAHLAVDPSNQYLIVSNHYGGSLAVLPIRADGALDELSQLVAMEGSPGPHKVEQKHAKPHFNLFDLDGRYVVVPDKGLDRIFSFSLDKKRGALSPAPSSSVSTREGAGPRHICFHPRLDMAYVINELDSTVTSYQYNSKTGKLTPRQILSSLPETFTSNNRAAEIVIDCNGRYLYASNRGHDSIAIYQIDPNTGLLSFITTEPTGGETPRFFALHPSGRFLYVANEDSDTIVQFEIEASSGRLTNTGECIKNGSPVCLVFRTL